LSICLQLFLYTFDTTNEYPCAIRIAGDKSTCSRLKSRVFECLTYPVYL
jgi:hypothetical protein